MSVYFKIAFRCMQLLQQLHDVYPLGDRFAIADDWARSSFLSLSLS